MLRRRATVVVLPLGAIHLCTTSKTEYSAGCPALYRELTEKKRTTWYCLQVVTMEKYSISLKTLFRVRNVSNSMPQCGQVHPQMVSARSWSLFHECPHSVQMFVPFALLIA